MAGRASIGRLMSRASPRLSNVGAAPRPQPAPSPAFILRGGSQGDALTRLHCSDTRLRRVVVSMLPMHSVTAAARLVSGISSGSVSCFEDAAGYGCIRGEDDQ